MCLEMFCKFFEKQVSITYYLIKKKKKNNQLPSKGETSLILLSNNKIRMCSPQNYYDKLVKVYNKNKCTFMTPNMLLSKCINK